MKSKILLSLFLDITNIWQNIRSNHNFIDNNLLLLSLTIFVTIWKAQAKQNWIKKISNKKYVTMTICVRWAVHTTLFLSATQMRLYISYTTEHVCLFVVIAVCSEYKCSEYIWPLTKKFKSVLTARWRHTVWDEQLYHCWWYGWSTVARCWLKIIHIWMIQTCRIT